MTELLNVRNNSFFSFLSIASRQIPNVLVFWYLARFSGPEIFGRFSYSHTLANTFLLFADFGFDLLLTTEIAKVRNNASIIFRQYFWIKIVLALSSLIFMCTFVVIKGGNMELVVLGCIFSFYMLFNTISNFYVAFFKGFERLDYDARVSFFSNLVLMILSIIIFSLDGHVYLIALSYVISRITGFLYCLRLSGKLAPDLRYKLIFQNVKVSLKSAFIFGMLVLLISLLYQLDTIMLGMFRSDSDVGVYNAVKNLLLVPFIIPGIVYSAVLPTLARMNQESEKKWLALNTIVFKVIFILTIPISIILYVYPKEIIEIVYSSKDYNSAIGLLKIFSSILFIRTTSDYLGVMLITSNRKMIQIYTAIFGIVLIILMNLFVIPKYGIEGTAVVFLIINIFVAIVYLSMNFQIFVKYIFNWKYLVVIFFSILITKGILYYDDLELIWGIFLICIAFCLIAFLFFFSKKELKSILNLENNLRKF